MSLVYDGTDETALWSWSQGRKFPRFWLCRSCQIYICEAWGEAAAQLKVDHLSHGHLLDVLRGMTPPPGYKAGISAMMALAFVADDEAAR